MGIFTSSICRSTESGAADKQLNYFNDMDPVVSLVTIPKILPSSYCDLSKATTDDIEAIEYMNKLLIMVWF